MKTKNTLVLVLVATIAASHFQTAKAQDWHLTGNAGTNPPTQFLGTTDNRALVFKTQGAPRMWIAQGGNIGIGTTSPGFPLSFANVDGDKISLWGSSGAHYGFGVQGNHIQIHSSGSASDIAFGYGSSAAFTEVMRIKGNGNVGIGTTSPASKLDVNGAIRISSPGDALIFADGQFLRDKPSSSGIEFEMHGQFLPDGDNSHSIGSSSQRWKDVWAADGTINTSDARDKKNIRDLDYGLKQVMQLRAVKFNWKDEVDSKDKIGVIAQEIQKVLPEVVRDYEYKADETTGKSEKVPAARLGVMYADIVPVLIKSIQELEMQVIELRKQINNNVQSSASTSSQTNAVDSKSVNMNASLEQNAPNPFNSITTIHYSIPVALSSAQIVVSNTSGSTIKTFNLTSKGAGSVTINAGELAAGSYHYSLLVNGKKADSKQMIIVK